jgi:hypothetical protein
MAASKSAVKAFFALCMTAILAIAVCGCDDLGEYEDTDAYYSSFGDIILVSAESGDDEDFSVKEYFYNEESREDFLKGEDGAYGGVPHGDYVYMAIPFENNIDMDSLALFMQSENDVAVYIYFYLVSGDDWDAILDGEYGSDKTDDGNGSGTTEGSDSSDTTGGEGESEPQNPVYDAPYADTRIGETVVHLKAGQWGSFVLDSFKVGGDIQKSIQINSDQYIVLQIRNNCGIVDLDEKTQKLIDPKVGIALDKAEITMTNLLIRALNVVSADETQGG